MISSEQPSLHKYEELSDLLRKKILTLASGSRLPSVRSMMKRYNLSLQTVNAAIKKLEAEDLIVTKRGSGIYVSDHRAVKLVVLHRSRHPSFYEDIKEASIRQAVLEAGWHLETRRHEILVEEASLSFSPEPKACAHLVTQDLANLRLGLLNQLVQQNVPIVVLGRETDIHHIDYITANDQQILRLLIKHFRSLGHKRLALLVNEPSSYFEIIRRIEHFCEIVEMMDLPLPTIIDCHTLPSQKTGQAAYEGLKRYLQNLQGRALPFTGLIVSSSSGCNGALRAFHEMKVSIPGQCSLASFEAEERHALSIPSVTDAGSLAELWGEWVVKVLRQRFEGNSTPSLGYRLPVELIARESTAGVPEEEVETTDGHRGLIGADA